MNVIKKFFVFFFALLVISLIVAIFLKKEYHVERTITIDKPVSEVFEYVRYLKNQDTYSYWAMIDPAIIKNYSNTDGNIGFTYQWKGNNEVGAGEMKIANIVDNERIDYDIKYTEPHVSTGKSSLIFKPEGDKTRVTWTMDGRLNYPMNIFLLIVDMDSSIGKKLNAGLVNLKMIMDQKPEAPIMDAFPLVDSSDINE